MAGAIARGARCREARLPHRRRGLYEDFGDEDSLISRTDVGGLERLVADGKVSEGMIPKIASCIEALRGGVNRAHILDGRIPHALLLEFFTREGIGTMMHPDPTGFRDDERWP